MGLRSLGVQGFRVQGFFSCELGFRVQGFRVQGFWRLGCRISGYYANDGDGPSCLPLVRREWRTEQHDKNYYLGFRFRVLTV